MDKGGNVLIHCLAGAHRAGTTACSWLIHADNLPASDAIKLGQSRRSAINPICDFTDMLNMLRSGLEQEGLLAETRKKFNAEDDIKLMR